MKKRTLHSWVSGLLLSLLSLPYFSFAARDSQIDTVAGTGYKIKTVIVDPGHGVRPSGARGNFSPGASGTYSFERNVTLAVALKLQKEIYKQLSNVKVVLTRTTDEDIAWQQRADIANENKGDLLISLHCNALSNKYVHEIVGHKHGKPVYHSIEVPDRSGKGVLLLVYGAWRSREEEKAIKDNLIEDDPAMNAPNPNDPASMILMNEYKRKYRKQSIHLAELLNTEFVETDGRHSDGIREQGLLVLCHSAMPAVLIEMGYINNPDDESYMNSEDGQSEIVATIIRALQNYKNEVESSAP